MVQFNNRNKNANIISRKTPQNANSFIAFKPCSWRMLFWQDHFLLCSLKYIILFDVGEHCSVTFVLDFYCETYNFVIACLQ